MNYKRSLRKLTKKQYIIGAIVLLVCVIALVAYIFIRSQTINKSIEVATDNVHLYENVNGGFTVKFGYLADSSPRHLVEYTTSSGSSISMQLVDTNPDIKAYKTTLADKGIDVIKFENVFKNVNVYYQVTNTRVKEQISLSSKEVPANFVYAVVTSGVDDVTQSDGGWVFKKNSATVFGIASLFMKDVSGSLSEDVAVKLEKVDSDSFTGITSGESVYKMTVTPDAAWLSDAARVYPVIIDPSIIF